MRGLLDRDPRAVEAGAELPLGWHWLYFRDPLRRSALGPDGHEARGAFMPAVGLPRRMWGGGRLRSRRPVVVGRPAELRSQVTEVTEKQGKSGRLVFATVSQVVLQDGLACVEEEQTIVYREAGIVATGEPADAVANSGGAEAASGAGGGDNSCGTDSASVASGVEAGGDDATPPPQPAWQETFRPDAVVLFRFSALTYNAHRIHYDRAYARSEGYPDLLVHAPLTALVLLDAATRNWQARVRTFEYRALSPLFVDQPVTLLGRSDGGAGRTVTAEAPGRRPAMRGRVALAATATER